MRTDMIYFNNLNDRDAEKAYLRLMEYESLLGIKTVAQLNTFARQHGCEGKNIYYLLAALKAECDKIGVAKK